MTDRGRERERDGEQVWCGGEVGVINVIQLGVSGKIRFKVNSSNFHRYCADNAVSLKMLFRRQLRDV